MVDICKASQRWAQMDEVARLEFIRDVVNEMLDEQGLGGDVEVKAYDQPDNAAEWDYRDNTIYVDEVNTLYSDDFKDVLDTAYHEGLHAAMDKENGGPVDIGDTTAQGNEFAFIYGWDHDPVMFDPGETVPGQRHIDEVYRVANQMTENAIGQCKMKDEYGADRNAGDGDFNFDEDDLDNDDGAGRDDDGGGIEIEMGEPFVRDADNDDGLLIEMLEDEAVVAPAPPAPPPGP